MGNVVTDYFKGYWAANDTPLNRREPISWINPSFGLLQALCGYPIFGALGTLGLDYIDSSCIQEKAKKDAEALEAKRQEILKQHPDYTMPQTE